MNQSPFIVNLNNDMVDIESLKKSKLGRCLKALPRTQKEADTIVTTTKIVSSAVTVVTLSTFCLSQLQAKAKQDVWGLINSQEIIVHLFLIE